MKERYKLLKDLPGLQAGAIFEWDESANCYKCDKQIWIGGTQKFHSFTAGTVTQTPEWFEKIKEIMVYQLTRSQLADCIITCSFELEKHGRIGSRVETMREMDYFLDKTPAPPVREQKLYTMDDLIDFGRYVRTMLTPPSTAIDVHVLDNWIQKAHPEDCIIPKKL